MLWSPAERGAVIDHGPGLDPPQPFRRKRWRSVTYPEADVYRAAAKTSTAVPGAEAPHWPPYAAEREALGAYSSGLGEIA